MNQINLFPSKANGLAYIMNHLQMNQKPYTQGLQEPNPNQGTSNMSSTYEKKRHLKAAAFLLGLLASALTQPLAMAIGIVPIQKWRVHVVNRLNNATLFVHCKSKDDDLGFHNLVGVGSEFQWSFKNNLWATTLFWCLLRKPNAYVSFEAFWIEKTHIWLNYRCHGGNCIWTAREDGVYLRNNPDSVDERVHKWKVKSI